MNAKERWFAAMAGERTDRPLFWPKIFDSSYAAQQIPRFSSMSVRELHDYTGTDILYYLPGILRTEYRGCGYSQYERDGCLYQEYTVGRHTLLGIQQYNPRSNSYHPRKMAVETRDDLLYMGEFYRSCHVFAAEKLLREAGEDAPSAGLWCHRQQHWGIPADGLSRMVCRNPKRSIPAVRLS